MSQRRPDDDPILRKILKELDDVKGVPIEMLLELRKLDEISGQLAFWKQHIDWRRKKLMQEALKELEGDD